MTQQHRGPARRPLPEIGTRFGAWTVTGHGAPVAVYARGTAPRVNCRCDCGTSAALFVQSLRSGRTTRCRDCGQNARASYVCQACGTRKRKPRT